MGRDPLLDPRCDYSAKNPPSVPFDDDVTALYFWIDGPPENIGWVNVGISRHTAEFSTATIARWWKHMGRQTYPEATGLLITADGGGSNGYRLRLWPLMLQHLAYETGLAITVAHFPPGTSRWNNIEHRMLSLISMNCREGGAVEGAHLAGGGGPRGRGVARGGPDGAVGCVREGGGGDGLMGPIHNGLAERHPLARQVDVVALAVGGNSCRAR